MDSASIQMSRDRSTLVEFLEKTSDPMSEEHIRSREIAAVCTDLLDPKNDWKYRLKPNDHPKLMRNKVTPDI